MTDDRVFARLRWQARRGMLELDLLLKRFMDAKLESLAPGELGRLEEVLRLEDNELLDLVMGRKQCHDANLKTMVDLIRSA
jgi:antitoxin CptB